MSHEPEEGYDVTGTQEFTDKYYLSKSEAPTGQLGELYVALYRRSVMTLMDGIQTDSFQTIFMDAVNSVKYDSNMKEVKFMGKSVDDILQLFVKPDKKGIIAENYYKESLTHIGKSSVSVYNIESAMKLAQQLREHPYTRDIVNLQSSDDVEVFKEMIVLYEIDNIPYRSMLDRIHIDHTHKTVQPYDFKCTYDVENGWEYSYLKNGYWLQVGLYDTALKSWIQEHDMSDYTVLPMIYIAVDTTGTCAPIVYEMQPNDVIMAQRGFSIRGKSYMGSMMVHRNVQWNLNMGIWNTGQDVYENNGVVKMAIKYR